MEWPDAYYPRLTRRFISVTVVCSLVPLLGVGWTINVHYKRSAEQRVMDLFSDQAANHTRIIELFLEERLSCLQLIAQTHSREHLVSDIHLREVLEIMNRQYDGSFTDLGVIDGDGNHLAYVGPYDLIDRNYLDAPWFREVVGHGVFISDMFTGFRQVPHFIIAVSRDDGEQRWILRATIDTEVFRSLVEEVQIGRSGEVYLVNGEGRFQTRPRLGGEILDVAPCDVGQRFEGIQVQVHGVRTNDRGEEQPEQIAARVWLDDPRWMLVVTQDAAEAFGEVRRTGLSMRVVLLASALSILLVSVLTTRYMVKTIRARDGETEALNKQLLQASKMASIGELSAGVAHEINNPLAIIMTERQILLDRAERCEGLPPDLEDQLNTSMSRIQVQLQRCKRITHNLLRFSRRTTPVLEEVDLNVFLREIVDLMEREAGTSGIEFVTNFDAGLPSTVSDPSQLQQVFLNLIVNAIDAHEGKPYGKIQVSTKTGGGGRFISITVADSGTGIRPEHLDKVFDPFFTTKPVGKGTGLGLALCYAVIEKLGGVIAVESIPGEGTEFVIELPVTHPDIGERDPG